MKSFVYNDKKTNQIHYYLAIENPQSDEERLKLNLCVSLLKYNSSAYSHIQFKQKLREMYSSKITFHLDSTKYFS